MKRYLIVLLFICFMPFMSIQAQDDGFGNYEDVCGGFGSALEAAQHTPTAIAMPSMTAAPTLQPMGTAVAIPPPNPLAAGTPAPGQLSGAAPAPVTQSLATPETMIFDNPGTNPFFDTEDDNLSTFGLDVDTASYTVARNYLIGQSLMPPPDAVRVEEFINYFPVDYPLPEDEAFSITLDAMPAPFGYEGHTMMRVGIQGKYIPPEDRMPVLLTFVIDVSGSMASENRLGLVKESLEILVSQLREDDRVAIVVYSDNSRIVLNPTSDHEAILEAIYSLGTEGSTNVEAGLQLGYGVASWNQREGENNRVIVLSDGVANVGVTSDDALAAQIRLCADEGITLSTIGFGMGNYNDALMERIADEGDGNYFYVDTLGEARRVFLYNLTGTLQVIAYDARIQVEFNADVVDRYRLLGYENRAIADEDFRNDEAVTEEAGEVGVGQSVTALYELALEDADSSGVMATVYVRYEDADTREIVEVKHEISVSDILASVDDAPENFRLQAGVAEFAELLRESVWAEDGNYSAVLALVEPLNNDSEAVSEFIDLVRLAVQYSDR